MKIFNKILFVIALSMTLLVIAPVYASAASLFFSPASGSYQTGKTFSVSVYVNSGTQSINAVSGTITFPNDLLSVSSLSKSGSIVNLWVQEPQYSSSGTVNFEGVIYNPGYTGSSGKIITINFRTVGEGDGKLAVSSGSVLANDGKGTNVYLGAGNFSLAVSNPGDVGVQPQPITNQQSTPQATGAEVPGTLRVSSSTHPDAKKWYNSPSAKFNWTLPKGAQAVSFSIDGRPTTDPGTASKGLVSSYSLSQSVNGVQYFHVRLKTSNGWGKASHFAFNTDTETPSQLIITPVDRSADNINFKVTVNDQFSGVESYSAKIDDSGYYIIPINPDNIISVPLSDRNAHVITVKVVDKAGNSIEQKVEVDAISDSEPVSIVSPPGDEAVQAASPWLKVPKYFLLFLLVCALVYIFARYVRNRWFAFRPSSVTSDVRNLNRAQKNIILYIEILESMRKQKRLSSKEISLLSSAKDQLSGIHKAIEDRIEGDRKSR